MSEDFAPVEAVAVDPDLVVLTRSEMNLAAQVGVMRQIDNLVKGRRDAYGASRSNAWSMHIEGAAAELAFARWINLFWSGSIGNLKADDVGTFQVRTSLQHGGRLILHEGDKEDRIFVFLTGSMPEFHLRGWILCRDGKKPEYWSDPQGSRPAYFVPQWVLNPMWKLREVQQ